MAKHRDDADHANQDAAQPIPPDKLQTELGRRHFLRGAAGAAAAAGVAALLPSIAAPTPLQEAASTEAAATVPAAHEPLLIYVRDALRGEAVIMHGDGEQVVIDQVLVSHLLRAQERAQA